jgi:SAM-dependent methyltransferase
VTTDEQRKAEFIDRILRDISGFFSIFSIYLGHRLGYYDILAAKGAMSPDRLAKTAAAAERYTREWLEQQATAGILERSGNNYSLPAPYGEVLTDRDSQDYLAPLSRLAAGVVRPLEQLLDAYRTGAGVPYPAYGDDLVEGQAGINRAMFLQLLGSEWLPAIPDVHARLQADPPARVADVGTGAGYSAIGIAQHYPKVQVDGLDLDAPSIKLARENAKAAGLSERVQFHVRDAGDPALAGQYDLVIALECIHDMSNPVQALAAMRQLAGEDGAVIVVDERVGDSLDDPTDVEWMMYGWSVLHCLPVGMVGENPAGTGTVMRPPVLQKYAEEAGFKRVEVLPIDIFFFRVYRLLQ